MRFHSVGKTAAAMLVFAASVFGTGSASDSDIAKRAVHEIRMYSRYSLWDNINVQAVDGTVGLTGEVSEPYKKSDLQRIVQRIPGVTAVDNELRVLPASFMDDRLRVEVARAIFRDPVLSGYALQPIPPIHIIVDNGHVTLEGIVSTEMERNVAAIRANGAGLSFGMVTNHLRVENPAKPKA